MTLTGVEEQYIKLLIGFLVGALIGLERQAVEIRSEKTGRRAEEWKPGVRTSGLFSLIGTISALFYSVVPTEIVFVVVLVFTVGMVISIIVAYTIMRFIRNPHDIGITTSMALAMAFLSGILVGLGQIILAITISVFVTFILAIKRSTEKILLNVEYQEIASALQIGILWLLVLPLIPEVTFLSINLRVLFTFMLLILALGFVAYLTIKNLGPTRGIVAFTIMGGMVSSEATTSNIIRMVNELKNIPENERQIMGSSGVLLANTTMIIRTLILTAILLIASINALLKLALTLIPAFLVGLVLSIYKLRKVKIKVFPRFQLENPLSYKTAAKFTGMFLIIAFTSSAFQRLFSDFGLYITGFFGGLVSILAVSITVASLYLDGTIPLDVAINTITIGTIAAVLNKVIYTRDAPWETRKKVYVEIVILSATLLLSAFIFSSILP